MQHEGYVLWRLRDTPGQSTLTAFPVQPVNRSVPVASEDAKTHHRPAVATPEKDHPENCAPAVGTDSTADRDIRKAVHLRGNSADEDSRDQQTARKTPESGGEQMQDFEANRNAEAVSDPEASPRRWPFIDLFRAQWTTL